MLRQFMMILIFICVPVISNATPTFVKGKDYTIINNSPPLSAMAQTPNNKILVQEYFSYGCPWCFRLEPTVEAWLKHKNSEVTFERVPVIFEQGWDIYAKAYYSAKALGILKKMTPAIFNAVHIQNLNLTSNKAMEQFFVTHGVNKNQFESVFSGSPTIQLEVKRAQSMMIAYKIYEIPTFLVDGKYKTSLDLAKGDPQKLIQILDFLVDKEKNNKKAVH